VIDYGLAKGLAHEAFGHAVESDLMEESVLSENGKLRAGLQIAGRGVDILDGSFERDWAYQPYSANGEKRETVAVVKDGMLQQGLGDVFSARKAGMAITGAGRAEYYGSVPLPRMTNIRLVTKNHDVLPGGNILEEEIKTLRTMLEKKRLLQQDHHYLLLGYRGGQVNIKTGDFVFQCDGAVNIADPELTVYKPGIFSGKILSVLESVTLSLGEERYDAIGTCGKAGQMVPSSGGGSGYIYLKKNENIR
jgi:TldD protein